MPGNVVRVIQLAMQRKPLQLLPDIIYIASNNNNIKVSTPVLFFYNHAAWFYENLIPQSVWYSTSETPELDWRMITNYL